MLQFDGVFGFEQNRGKAQLASSRKRIRESVGAGTTLKVLGLSYDVVASGPVLEDRARRQFRRRRRGIPQHRTADGGALRRLAASFCRQGPQLEHSCPGTREPLGRSLPHRVPARTRRPRPARHPPRQEYEDEVEIGEEDRTALSSPAS